MASELLNTESKNMSRLVKSKISLIVGSASSTVLAGHQVSENLKFHLQVRLYYQSKAFHSFSQTTTSLIFCVPDSSIRRITAFISSRMLLRIALVIFCVILSDRDIKF